MRYSRSDHAQIVTSLRLVGHAIGDASAAVAAGDVATAQEGLNRAATERGPVIEPFPAIVVNREQNLPFADVYADFYRVDLLIVVAQQWPDPAPTAMSSTAELIAAFGDELVALRRLRARPWADVADGAAKALEGLDSLISKTETLQADLGDLVPPSRIDPRRFLWNGQDFKVQFLDGVGGGDELGEVYRLLFSLDHAIDRTRWSLDNKKLPGASRRVAEAVRVQGQLIDWLDEHQPE